MTLFFLSLRETLEASLVIGIVLSITRTSARSSSLPVWIGAFCGLLAGLLWAAGMLLILPTEVTDLPPLESGCLLFAAAFLLGWTALLSGKPSTSPASLNTTTALHVRNGRSTALFLLCFFTVSRESAELAIFVRGATLATQQNTADMLFAIAGIVVALVCTAAIMRGFFVFPFRIFSAVMTIFVTFLGASLVARGIGTIQNDFLSTPPRIPPSSSSPMQDNDPPLSKAALLGSAAYAAVILLSARRRQ